MTKNFGSTKMPSARDKRRESRKQYRRNLRKFHRGDIGTVAADINASNRAVNSSEQTAPSSTSSLSALAGDDGESDSKRCSNRRNTNSPPNRQVLCPSARRVVNKASRLEQAAARRAAKLLRNGQDTLSSIDNGVFLEIASFASAPELHSLLRVNRRWRWTLQAHDCYLWRPHCTRVWSGRLVSRPELQPFVQSAIAAMPRPTTGDIETEIPAVDAASWTEKPPQSWREALCASIIHSRQTSLTPGELVCGKWLISFKLDASIPPQRIQFFSAPMPHVKTAGFPQMPWALYEEGTLLHVHVFPEQSVSRGSGNWGWTMHNRFVSITPAATPLSSLPLAIGDAELAAYLPARYEPMLPSPPSDSESVDATEAVQSPEEQLPAATSYESDTSCEPGEASPERVKALPSLQLRPFFAAVKLSSAHGAPPFVPSVSGHGGGCDGEDPPPLSDSSSSQPCDAADFLTEAGCAAGHAGVNMDDGTTLQFQQVGSRLSKATRAFFDAVMLDEYALCVRSKELCTFQAMGSIRLMDHAPRRVRQNFPAHLLDQGRPRKPP